MVKPVAIPPQNTPPFDPGSNVFNKTWWLAFSGLKDAINRGNPSVIYVTAFGAIDDWDSATETGTDNTAAIQAALDSLTVGQTLFFPVRGTGKYLITAPLIIPRGTSGTKGITIRGCDILHCQLLYVGSSVQACIIDMIGCDSVTWTEIAVLAWSDNPAFFPRTVLTIGRVDYSGNSHHTFNRCSFMGNVSDAVVYSISSEENSWHGCYLFSNNGKGFAGTSKHIYYTSYKDDLALYDPGLVNPRGNLDIWFSHCHFINFSATDSADNDCVYEQMYGASGDHVYRDCYVSPGAGPPAKLGWGFRFVTDPVTGYSGSNYVVEANRVAFAKGLLRVETHGGPAQAWGLRFARNTIEPGDLADGMTIYGEDGVTLSRCSFDSNFNVGNPGACPSSVDFIQMSSVYDDSEQTLTVRSIAAYCSFYLPSPTAGLSLGGGSFSNWVILSANAITNGPLTVDANNAFANDPLLQLADPGNRGYGVYFDVNHGVSLIYDYNAGAGAGALFTRDSHTALRIGGDEVMVFAASGGDDAGKALTVHVQKNHVNLFGNLAAANTTLSDPVFQAFDAAGATSDQAFILMKSDSTPYFSIYGGSDPTFPGLVQTKELWAQALAVLTLAGGGLRMLTVDNVGAVAAQAIPTASGAAGGDLTGTYPNPTIANPHIPYVNVVAASSALTFTTSYVDIPGATLTLTKTGKWLIIASCPVNSDPTDGSAVVELVAGGAAQTPTMVPVSTLGSGIQAVPSSRQWVYSGTNADVVKLHGKKISGTGVSGVANNVALTAIFLQ